MEAVQEQAVVVERKPYETVLETMRKEVKEGIGLLGKDERPGDDLDGLQQVVNRFTKASELEDPLMQQNFTVDSGLAKDAALLREDPLRLADHLEDEFWRKEKKGQVTLGEARGVTKALDHFRELYAVPPVPGQPATKMPAGSLQ